MLIFVPLPEHERTEVRTHHYSHIECDVCGERSPPAAELLAGGGLSGLGWFIGPGQHRCPKHFTDDTPARGPEYRDA